MALSPINRTGIIYVGEALFVGVDWDGQLPSGVTLSNGSSKAIDELGNDVSGTVLGSHVISGFLSVALLSNVTAGKTYKIITDTTFSNGETQREKITINAVDIEA